MTTYKCNNCDNQYFYKYEFCNECGSTDWKIISVKEVKAEREKANEATKAIKLLMLKERRNELNEIGGYITANSRAGAYYKSRIATLTREREELEK